MYVFVLSVHIVLCIFLVLIVLMQPGKGADVSSAFGGGASSQLFGASGPGNFLTRGTGAVAGLFFVTSIALTFLSEDAAGIGGDAGELVDELGDEGEEGGGFGAGGATTPPTPPPAPEVPSLNDAPTPIEGTPGATPAPAGSTPAPGASPTNTPPSTP